METSFLWFGVFSGSFGVRSIVLCKCSGNVLIGLVFLRHELSSNPHREILDRVNFFLHIQNYLIFTITVTLCDHQVISMQILMWLPSCQYSNTIVVTTLSVFKY